MDTPNKTNTMHSTHPPCHVQCPAHARHRGFGAVARECKSYKRSTSPTPTPSSHIEHQLTKLLPTNATTPSPRPIDPLALASRGTKVGLAPPQMNRPFGPHFWGRTIGLASPRTDRLVGPSIQGEGKSASLPSK